MNNVYAILNLAFITPNNLNLKDSRILFKNINLTKQIIKFSLEIKPKKFINFSTMSVYSENSGTYDEQSPTNCEFNKDANYGIAKLISEKLLFSHFSQTNIKLLNLRISQVYGDGMNNSRIIPQMISEITIKNQVTLFNKGERVSNFISIKYLTKLLLLMVKSKYTGIYNVGEENISYLKLAKRIIIKYGNKNTKIIFKKDNFQVNKFYLNTNKLMKIFSNVK
jgi:nucleoside-diphosphate-sugar epimerase